MDNEPAIHLPPELQAFVEQQIAHGEYASFREMVQESIRFLKHLSDVRENRLEALRRDIQVGIDQLDRGEGIEFTDDHVEKVKQRGREILAARRRAAGEQAA